MYKVVRKSKGRLYSSSIHFNAILLSILKKWLVKYVPNKWVKAKIGKLFVFKNLDDAIRFAKEIRLIRFNEIEIWRCKTTDTRQLPLMGSSIYTFLIFWTGDIPPSPINNTRPPKGTFVASKVMLTKRVRVWNAFGCPS